ncbi:MAG: GNAT family N-acetyltransferase [Candidatus Wallbacteria bacterium]
MYAGIFIKKHLTAPEVKEIENLEKLIMGITGNNAFTLQPIAHYGAFFTLEISGVRLKNFQLPAEAHDTDCGLPFDIITINNESLCEKLNKLNESASIIAVAQYIPSIYDAGHAHLFAFYSVTQIRATGITSLFLKSCETFLSKNFKINSIDLTVDGQNTSAVKFYEKNGFLLTAEKHDFYGSGVTRLILTKHLPPVNL